MIGFVAGIGDLHHRILRELLLDRQIVLIANWRLVEWGFSQEPDRRSLQSLVAIRKGWIVGAEGTEERCDAGLVVVGPSKHLIVVDARAGAEHGSAAFIQAPRHAKAGLEVLLAD